MTVDQVAAKLLVSASQILAIESGRLPSSYSAGYYERTVRKYANFLNIELDQAALPAAAAAIGQAHAVNQDGSPAARLAGFTPQRVGIGGRIDRPTIESGWNAKSWIAGVVVLILVVAGFMFRDRLFDLPAPGLGSGNAAKSATPPAVSTPAASSASSAPSASVSSSSASPANAPTAASPASLVTGTTLNEQTSRPAGVPPSGDSLAPVVEAERTASSRPQDSTPSPATPESAAAAAPSAPTPADSPVHDGQVQVTFAAPCWVQLIKSDGTRSEKIFQPDQVLEFPVDTMASLVIGNARSARMTIDGGAIDLNPFMKGDVVRMSDAALQEALH